MAIYDSFSKRMKHLRDHGKPEVYQSTKLPSLFRRQLLHIWRDSIGECYSHGDVNPVWLKVHNTLAREKGVAVLGTAGKNAAQQCAEYLLNGSTEEALDTIELTFQYINGTVRYWRDYERERWDIRQAADDAIDELNQRFREHRIGYQFVGGELIRVDSQFVHAEVVKPALHILHEVDFRGPSEEFLKAHEHYRHGRAKEAIAEALKAFESTMMAICDAHKWTYPPGATARPLLEILFNNGLIPAELQSHFTALRSTLEAGLPTVRNKKGGHGQGAVPVGVPDYLAAYALHLAGTNILFMVQAHKALP
jgi:hypothetical protein